MEDSMIDMPNMSSFDDKIGNKRVRDGEDKPIGRLEKRPSGIIGLNDFEDYSKERVDEGEKHGGGIIDTFISNVFHKNNESGQDGDQVKNDAFVEDKKDDLSLDVNGENGDQGGKGGGIIDTFISNVFHKNESGQDGDQVKNDAFVANVEDKKDDLSLGVNGGKGGGIINAFFSNVFHKNESENGEYDQAKSDVLNEVEEKSNEVELNVEKLEEKKDSSPELPSKPLDQGNNQKMKPDDYSERVFFLNNN
ncbi:hypothetical protein Tco_0485272 [Tanacetum coccineum]